MIRDEHAYVSEMCARNEKSENQRNEKLERSMSTMRI